MHLYWISTNRPELGEHIVVHLVQLPDPLLEIAFSTITIIVFSEEIDQMGSHLPLVLSVCCQTGLGNLTKMLFIFRRTPHSEKSLLLQHLCASDSVECISALYSLGLLDTVTITSGIILEAAYRQGYQPVWISQSPYVRWEDTFRLAVQYDLIHRVLHWAPDRVGTVEWRDSYADGIIAAAVTHDLENYRAMVAQWGVEIEAEDILRVAGELDAYDWVRSFVEGWKDCSCQGGRCQTVSLYYQLGGQYDADAISYLYAHSIPGSSVERYLRTHHPDLTYCDHLHYRLHYYHPLLHTITANPTLALARITVSHGASTMPTLPSFGITVISRRIKQSRSFPLPLTVTATVSARSAMECPLYPLWM